MVADSSFDWQKERRPIYLLLSTVIGIAVGSALRGLTTDHAYSPLQDVPELKNAPKGVDLSQTIPNLVVKSSSHLAGLWKELLHINGDSSGFADVAVALAKCVMEMVTDYQAWISNFYHYLFRPSDSFVNFSKAVIFMRSAGQLVSTQLNDAVGTRKVSYYEDVSTYCVQPEAIATTNYGHLVERAGWSLKDVYFLNGTVAEQFDPYLQQTVNNADWRITIPSIFVQSSVKPFTDVSLMSRYHEFYEKSKSAGLLVVLGFGFNGDDGHINALVRQLLMNGTSVLVLDYEGRQSKQTYVSKLRLEPLPEQIHNSLHVKPLDRDRTSNGAHWLDVVTSMEP